MTVKFTKAGTYTVFCDLHPGMKAPVKVLKKGAKVPTAKQDAAALKQQADAAIKTAKGLATAQPPANTVSLGVAAKGGLEYFGMVPATLTVAPGTTVKFVMCKGSLRGPHRHVRARATSASPTRTSARSRRPSSPRRSTRAACTRATSTPVSLSPTTHGNGFWSSGALDGLRRRRSRTTRA